MNKSKVTKLSDFFVFLKYLGARKKHINAAKDAPIKTNFAVNEVAAELHPYVQYLKVKEVIDRGEGKSFVLVPNTAKGTKECAIFRAGQYLSVSLKIGDSILTRPYSIASSPLDALHGSYEIMVKRNKDGFASNYILDNWKEGTEVKTSGPLGEFYYSPLKDAPTVIGIAGGSGITPLLSMIRSINEGSSDIQKLILLYGSRDSKSIIYKKELDELAKKGKKVQVVYVLSNSEEKGYEHGFINADLIRKYAPKTYSIFACGPQAMYNFLDGELAKLKLKEKYINHEVFGEFKNPEKEPDFPKDAIGKTFQITVDFNGQKKVIQGAYNETLLTSMEKAGIAAPSHCRSGVCGFCHSLLVKGRIYTPKSVDYRREADYKFNFIHPCCSFPVSDVEIDVPVPDEKE
jgi:ferredoxin-NADP reductase